jgi:hypothetical protein
MSYGAPAVNLLMSVNDDAHGAFLDARLAPGIAEAMLTLIAIRTDVEPASSH